LSWPLSLRASGRNDPTAIFSHLVGGYDRPQEWLARRNRCDNRLTRNRTTKTKKKILATSAESHNSEAEDAGYQSNQEEHQSVNKAW
jgi:hypothetical protein